MRLVLLDNKDKRVRDVHVPEEFTEFAAQEFDRIADYIGRILTLRGMEGIRATREALQAELRDEAARRRVDMPAVPDPHRKTPPAPPPTVPAFLSCRHGCRKAFTSARDRDQHEQMKHGTVLDDDQANVLRKWTA